MTLVNSDSKFTPSGRVVLTFPRIPCLIPALQEGVNKQKDVISFQSFLVS